MARQGFDKSWERLELRIDGVQGHHGCKIQSILIYYHFVSSHDVEERLCFLYGYTGLIMP
jgi:hypothetical protein